MMYLETFMPAFSASFWILSHLTSSHEIECDFDASAGFFALRGVFSADFFTAIFVVAFILINIQ